MLRPHIKDANSVRNPFKKGDIEDIEKIQKKATKSVWTVVQAVLTATFNYYGDRQISTPYKINTPELIDKKFGTVDYVREGTSYTKFDTNPPT